MIGVTYNDFWELNPISLSPFIKAFGLKREYEDSVLWMQGQYIQAAIASVMSKGFKYPNKPFHAQVKADDQQEIKRKFLQRMEILNTRFKGE